MPVTVRPATQNDLSVIYSFVCSLEDIAFPLADFEACYYSNIAGSNNIYLVATTEADDVIGYISCHGQQLLHHCGWVFEIQEMFVAQEARGRGIGKLLINELSDRLSQRGYQSFEVTANNKRKETHEFYRSCGFTETHKKFTKSV